MSANATEITKEKLYEDFNTVVAETEQLLKSAATAGSERATSAAKATDQYVNENPWRAVGIVAAIAGLTGVLAGLLIARR